MKLETTVNRKPTLVIMAAGMGSRFGGNKQIAPVDDAGHIIIDFSIYDAIRAGFGRVVCVIKPGMEADFRAAIGDAVARHVDLRYAYQTLDAIPAGTPVSMNLWAFRRGVLEAFPRMFEDFLRDTVPANPLKAEFYLPNVPKALIAAGTGRVRLLNTDERWYGMTYREDAEAVRAAIAGMKQKGVYPKRLWG